MFSTLILCAFDITTHVQNYTQLVIIIIDIVTISLMAAIVTEYSFFPVAKHE